MKVDWPYSEIGQKMANDQLLYFTVFSKILVWLHWGRKHLCMENYGEFMVICQSFPPGQSFPPYGIHIVVIQVIFPLRRNKIKQHKQY